MNPNNTELLALCFQLPDLTDDALPEWLPMIPAGTFAGRDGRSWVNNQPEAVISATLSYPGGEVAIDGKQYVIAVWAVAGVAAVAVANFFVVERTVELLLVVVALEL